MLPGQPAMLPRPHQAAGQLLALRELAQQQRTFQTVVRRLQVLSFLVLGFPFRGLHSLGHSWRGLSCRMEVCL